MHCSYCKTESMPGSRFCAHCGAPMQAAGERGSSPLAPYGGGGTAQAVTWVQWVDQTEGAFGLRVPRGWNARGGVHRGGMYNLPECFFEATDPTGRIGFVFRPETFQFSEPVQAGAGMLGAFMGLLGGGLPSMGMPPQAPPLPFQDAAAFARGFLLEHWRRRWPDIALVHVAINSVAQSRQQQEAQQSCQMRAGLEMMRPQCSAADLVVEYGVSGRGRVRQGAIISVSRLINPMPMAPQLPWAAEVMAVWYAPSSEHAIWDPILRRVLESVHVNPHWQAAQLAHDNGVALQGQMDRSRRIQQISQTLSQTSDIVNQSYWSKEQIRQQHAQGRAASAAHQTDWQHEYSNAILGWEDRYDDRGNHYSLSAGHERVWVDAGGGFHYGNQLTHPDPTWSELKPR